MRILEFSEIFLLILSSTASKEDYLLFLCEKKKKISLDDVAIFELNSLKHFPSLENK